MWSQNYAPISGSLPLSALAAALPIFVLLILIGVLESPPGSASLAGLGAAVLVARWAYGMPWAALAGATAYGAAFGLFPIGWIVFGAVMVYRVSVEGGRFEMLKDSVGHLTDDPRLQVLLIAFAFGAFLEGAADWDSGGRGGRGWRPGVPSAVRRRHLPAGQHAPVAFGAIGIPITTMSVITGMPVGVLSAAVGRICAPVSFIVPAYLILVMSGWKGLRGALPAVAVCGGVVRRDAVFCVELPGTAAHRSAFVNDGDGLARALHPLDAQERGPEGIAAPRP